MAADANRDNLRRILLAAAPLFAEPPPLPPILQPATLTEIFGNLSLATGDETNRILLVMQPSEPNKPRPEQGGQCITEDWLRSLKSQDCQWRYRMTAEEFLDLTEALQIPDPFKTSS
ncbi:hypothetical protein B0H13DRAFT_2549486 [Mycena leptocephala]|nr:hypothetical protein B0H13DRAFT_2549486 [Mycena leptocephala]